MGEGGWGMGDVRCEKAEVGSCSLEPCYGWADDGFGRTLYTSEHISQGAGGENSANGRQMPGNGAEKFPAAFRVDTLEMGIGLSGGASVGAVMPVGEIFRAAVASHVSLTSGPISRRRTVVNDREGCPSADADG